MGKARTGFYAVKGDALTRTHPSCPKCGPGIFLADHANRRSCGRCGYMEARAAPKIEVKPEGKPAPRPKAPKSPPAAAPPAPSPPAASGA